MLTFMAFSIEFFATNMFFFFQLSWALRLTWSWFWWRRRESCPSRRPALQRQSRRRRRSRRRSCSARTPRIGNRFFRNEQSLLFLSVCVTTSATATRLILKNKLFPGNVYGSLRYPGSGMFPNLEFHPQRNSKTHKHIFVEKSIDWLTYLQINHVIDWLIDHLWKIQRLFNWLMDRLIAWWVWNISLVHGPVVNVNRKRLIRCGASHDN